MLKIKKFIKSIESRLSTTTKILIGAIVIWAIVFAYFAGKINAETRVTSATVMLTLISGRSGGSGVVIYNSKYESAILTNKHVCNVIANGGNAVNTKGKTALITRYAVSSVHDLCIAYVQADFEVSAKIAEVSPKLYSEASISGHPSLMPNIVSRGHVSGNKQIDVFLGARPCTQSEIEIAAPLCMFFNGMPIIKKFDATLVSAMIMPGSSGSGVYNDKNELIGLAFAGSSELSYAYIVPYEYMINFVYHEVKNFVGVDYDSSLLQKLENAETAASYYKYIEEKCKTADTEEFARICRTIKNGNYFKGVSYGL